MGEFGGDVEVHADGAVRIAEAEAAAGDIGAEGGFAACDRVGAAEGEDAGDAGGGGDGGGGGVVFAAEDEGGAVVAGGEHEAVGTVREAAFEAGAGGVGGEGEAGFVVRAGEGEFGDEDGCAVGAGRVFVMEEDAAGFAVALTNGDHAAAVLGAHEGSGEEAGGEGGEGAVVFLDGEEDAGFFVRPEDFEDGDGFAVHAEEDGAVVRGGGAVEVEEAAMLAGAEVEGGVAAVGGADGEEATVGVGAEVEDAGVVAAGGEEVEEAAGAIGAELECGAGGFLTGADGEAVAFDADLAGAVAVADGDDFFEGAEAGGVLGEFGAECGDGGLEFLDDFVHGGAELGNGEGIRDGAGIASPVVRMLGEKTAAGADVGYLREMMRAPRCHVI